MALKPLRTAAAVALACLFAATAPAVEWPEPTAESRPWTRWWWHGSAVDQANLSRLIEEYHRVGLGGVEVTCIYGVQGAPHPNRDYLSPEWRAALRHTIDEAQRLGMGVDLPAGSGWRMGGPGVPMELANRRLVLEQARVTGPAPVAIEFQRGVTPQAAAARSDEGERIDLTDKIENGRLEWDAPEGEWLVVAAGQRWSGDRVKRPGPGGAGLNINPFSRRSVSDFLDRFAARAGDLSGVRAQFHDSFEYAGDWQPEFFDEFRRRRGYSLRDYLPELAGVGDPDRVGRVKHDYRLTLDDLVLENLVGAWVDWSHRLGMLARNQSHGSPANWLDLYAAVDIPETESFGRLYGGDADPRMLQFAASAANVTGKRLVSSETATWLDEHFNVTLGQVKQIVDRQALAGVNHVVYHGTAYSPDDARWPGWLFYASTQLNPQNPIWRDLPTLNGYTTRLQSVLQESKPDADVLLYWPIADARHNPDGLRQELRVHDADQWLEGRPLGEAAERLAELGVGFDYVSDRLLERAEWDGDRIATPGARYAAVVVPKCQRMPLDTAERLAHLAASGATILVWGDPPSSLPGMAALLDGPSWQSQRDRFAAAVETLRAHVPTGGDLGPLLGAAGISAESELREAGFDFLRRRLEGQPLYLIANQTGEPIDRRVTLRAGEGQLVLMEPMSGAIGVAAAEPAGAGRRRVRLQLEAGETVLVTFAREASPAPGWAYRDAAGPPVELTGWSVDFIAGGPSLPAAFETDRPRPWTESADPAADAFAGTAVYACRFDKPAGGSRFLLDLGEVDGSARVLLNGARQATLLGPTHKATLSGLKPAGNLLEVEVTGVAANRIRDLDRRGVAWRIFEDINLVTIDYAPFDASAWPVRPLGLSGPVTLAPLSGDAGH
ncbi:glycosyl hydrolase [Botrimarina sp.]|uniref:glycosyl hydrolase n=1 Tax=Botrimarina sp. TaxID=2795802 RepID=UPI0032F063B7